MVLGVGLHRDLGIAPSAFKVEAEDFNPQVLIIDACFLAHVKLRSNVEKIAASIAANTHGEHHADIVLLLPLPLDLSEFGRVEVWRIVLVENLSL